MAGSSSCASGQHAVGTLDARHLAHCGSFSSATIYFPEGSGAQLPSVVIVGGWGCGEQVMAAWAPFFASHGIVAMTIGTPKPWSDTPLVRCQALLDASIALQSENNRAGSPLHNRLNVSARAVMGYSLGGGGAQLAAIKEPALKCIIAVCPHDGRQQGVPFPATLSASVPVLILCSEHDKHADSQAHAWAQYHKISAPKLIFEISDGDHFSANGPGGGTEKEFEKGAEPCALCNYCCAMCCCGCAPFPCGSLNGPTGHSTNNAPRGAIGGVALAWLQLFLLGDESALSLLATRPDLASGFESQNIKRV